MITDVIMLIIIITFGDYCYYYLEMMITMVAMTIQRNKTTSVTVRTRMNKMTIRYDKASCKYSSTRCLVGRWHHTALDSVTWLTGGPNVRADIYYIHVYTMQCHLALFKCVNKILVIIYIKINYLNWQNARYKVNIFNVSCLFN